VAAALVVDVAERKNTAGDIFAMSQKDQVDSNSGTGLVVEPARPQLKKPPMYKVVMLNDDYTPMEFVIMVLENLFRMDHEKAVQVMLNVHQKGKGVCGVFPHEVAQTKIAQVLELARQSEHPLQCTMEEA
jgi:ATP-dependent Clp protease adaptor protein ClpS